MKLLILTLMLATTSFGQENQDYRAIEAAHASMKKAPIPAWTTMGEKAIPRYSGIGRKDVGIIHIKLPTDRGLKDPMFCWVDDFTEKGASVKVLKLTPREIVIEAKRGHLIDWSVSHR